MEQGDVVALEVREVLRRDGVFAASAWGTSELAQ